MSSPAGIGWQEHVGDGHSVMIGNVVALRADAAAMREARADRGLLGAWEDDEIADWRRRRDGRSGGMRGGMNALSCTMYNKEEDSIYSRTVRGVVPNASRLT